MPDSENEDVLDDVRDILVGWCRPMTNEERLEAIATMLGVPETEWVWDRSR